MGNIDYATVLFGYFGMLGMSGIYNYGLREISAHRNNRKVVTDTYKNLFCIGLITNLLFLAIYILFILFLSTIRNLNESHIYSAAILFLR